MDQQAFMKKLVWFLIDRGYEPGERIPSERDLGLRFEVGRSQVRETIAYLEALRIIERRAKSGLFMAEEQPSIEALALFGKIGIPLSDDDVRQTVEMRLVHEVEAVKLACARRTDVNLQRMQQVLDETLTDLDDPERVATHDRKFHSEIVRSTRNDVFLRIVDIFYLMSAPRRIRYFHDPERRRTSLAEHHLILAAIADRDVERAVAQIKAHLQGVDSYWRGLIASPAPVPEEVAGPM